MYLSKLISTHCWIVCNYATLYLGLVRGRVSGRIGSGSAFQNGGTKVYYLCLGWIFARSNIWWDVKRLLDWYLLYRTAYDLCSLQYFTLLFVYLLIRCMQHLDNKTKSRFADSWCCSVLATNVSHILLSYPYQVWRTFFPSQTRVRLFWSTSDAQLTKREISHWEHSLDEMASTTATVVHRSREKIFGEWSITSYIRMRTRTDCFLRYSHSKIKIFSYSV